MCVLVYATSSKGVRTENNSRTWYGYDDQMVSGRLIKWKTKELDKGVKQELRVKEVEATGINQHH